jgi:hypothetical protein
LLIAPCRAILERLPEGDEDEHDIFLRSAEQARRGEASSARWARRSRLPSHLWAGEARRWDKRQESAAAKLCDKERMRICTSIS